MVKRGKPVVSISVTDNAEGTTETFEGTGCAVVLFERDKAGEVRDLSCALQGNVSDNELLIMLRFLLDKMQEAFDDETLASGDLNETLSHMKDVMLAKGKEISVGSTTVQ